MIREQVVREVSVRREAPAYRSGWEDGRFGPPQTFITNPSLAAWSDHGDRLAYYRGHRDGRRVRDMLSGNGAA